MSKEIICEGCGREYRIIPEITDAGGTVKPIGLALKGYCVCGCPLGNIGSLWIRDRTHEKTETGHQRNK